MASTSVSASLARAHQQHRDLICENITKYLNPNGDPFYAKAAFTLYDASVEAAADLLAWICSLPQPLTYDTRNSIFSYIGTHQQILERKKNPLSPALVK